MASGADIAKAYVQIIPSAEGIKGRLTDIMGGEADSAGRSAGGRFASIFGTVAAAGLAAAGAAAAGLASLVKSAVAGFSEYEQLAGGVEKIFDEANTNQILADANAAYKELNMSANEYLSAINQTGATFAQTMGDQKGYDVARTGMQAIADYASGTGRNLDELNEKYAMITRSTSSYQSIADQFSGILPATSKDFLEQAQAAGFLSDSYKSLTEVPVAEYQEAVTQMLAQGVDEMGLAGNTMAESMKTISGSLAMTRSAWSNLVTGMADDNADFDALIGNFVESVGAMADNILPRVAIALQGVGQLIMSLAPMISAYLPQLIQTVLPGLLQAGTSLLTGLLTAAPTLATAAVDVISQLAGFFVQNLPLIIDSAIQIIIALINGLTEALPQLISYLPEIILSITTTLLDNLPMIIQAGIQLLVAVISGLIQALPRLVGYIPTIISSLFRALVAGVGQMLSAGGKLLGSVMDGIRNGISRLLDVGKNIVEGIWKGISNGLKWIKSKLTEWVGDVTSFLKKLLGIGSPSKLMRDEVGIYMAEGIGVGFENGMADVERTMRNSMPDFGELVGETTVPVSYVADAYGLNGIGAARGSGMTVNYGGVSIIIEGRGKDANELARELQIELNRRIPAWA
ncbi:MAG: hypothetical protein II410_04850 [Ruminococcus sp.]|nr:hypothetical protein [Ruminococcus sp.]